MKRREILVLYIHPTGYLDACLKAFAQMLDAHIHVLHHEQGKDSPFSPPEFHLISYKEKTKALRSADFPENPSLVLVAGWADQDYLALAKKFKQQDVPVVMGMDTKWLGTKRQYMASLLGKYHLGRFFTHAFVAGDPQYAFAVRLGFKAKEIINGYYSADTSLFEQTQSEERVQQKTLLFVGRLVPEKGLAELLEAYREVRMETGTDWKLKIIGKGVLKELVDEEEVIYKSFVQPSELTEEFAKARAFILPSKFEPWGVVLHEAAASGLPLIASSETGSAEQFLIHNYNGFQFDHEKGSLPDALRKLFALPEEDLKRFGQRSHELAKSHSPELWAAKLASLI